MEPETESADEGLAGLLNRALNKGAILNADLLITVNDIPLVAVRLQAAIANIETMIEYGIMTQWEPAMTDIDDDYLAEKLETSDEPGLGTDRERKPESAADDGRRGSERATEPKTGQPPNRS
ncbi:gas vesicle protein GvpJ [Natronococcus occultus]|uniref:Gas vesicle protein n=1 Tax=Natronococcus occultus SP4 TaxID=694430 RepID=L0K3J2_9EURY|nr:gas vesicle protein GvpJ [Natronococcus occultus]AGB39842.1 Gas vesicle protein [Natronococcus occultus SP4]